MGGAPDTRCSWTRRALAMDFSPCLSAKSPFGLGWAGLPSGLALAPLAKDLLSTLPVEEKPISGLTGRSCDGLFSLPVDEKLICATFESLVCWPAVHEKLQKSVCKGQDCPWLAQRLRWAFPPCLSRKRPFHGLGVRLGCP